MITQTIKSWLNRLFAWWPWKQTSATGYPQAVSSANKGVSQEQMWRPLEDGPVPQAGIAPVAVEQEMDGSTPDAQRIAFDERSERITQPSTAASEKQAIPPVKETTNDLTPTPDKVPTHEQQMAFLHYLVSRGIVNEGFPEGQEPEQYRCKR